MAGTVTVTRTPLASPWGKLVEKISVAWTSDASGNATGTMTKLYGFVIKVITDPDGSAAPTDNYDITLVDENAVDALDGKLADRDTANNEQVYPTPTSSAIPAFVCGDHTFTVANAGNAKSGVCTFYITEDL